MKPLKLTIKFSEEDFDWGHNTVYVVEVAINEQRVLTVDATVPGGRHKKSYRAEIFNLLIAQIMRKRINGRSLKNLINFSAT